MPRGIVSLQTMIFSSEHSGSGFSKFALLESGLLVSGVLLTCLASASAQDSSSPDKEEDQAIQQLRDAGGIVQSIAANTSAKEAKFHLSGADVTDDQLAPLPQVKELVWLNLRGTKITDKALEHVGKCHSLTNLQLPLTQITDTGLSSLSGLEELEILNLYGTEVSDTGLQQLASLKKLRKLYVWQTKVTPAGAAQLQEKLPDVEIVLGIDLSTKDDDATDDTKQNDDKKSDDSKNEDGQQDGE